MTNYDYKGVVFADLHGGAFPAKIWYNELKKGALTHTSEMDELDFVIVAGDLFDAKISLNSDHAKYVIKFVTKLLDICKKKNAKLRIIKGTESHDNKQLEILESLDILNECDFRIVHTATSEQLFPDMNVLYIPEEYMEDTEEFYKDLYIPGAYDMIIGHGLVDKAVWFAELQESEDTMSKAPVFKLKDLMELCSGPVYFGHIHKPMSFERFRYVGSFSRWAFGEQEEKGFIEVHMSPSKHEYQERFIVNKHARKYDTLSVTYPSVLSEDNEHSQMKYLMELSDSLVVDYLRLEVNIPEEHPKPMFITNMIGELFARRSNIKLKINNNSKLREKQETDTKIKNIYDKYGFIFNKKMKDSEKISEFIKIRYGKVISADKIDFYLFGNNPNEG